MKADLKQTTNSTSGGGYSSPFDSMIPWNSIKNYSNHSTGASQSGSASAEKNGGSGGLLGGINLPLLLLGGVVIFLLMRK